MNTVKRKLEVLNTNVVNVLQSCLFKLCPTCQHAIGGGLAFSAKSVLIELRFWLLSRKLRTKMYLKNTALNSRKFSKRFSIHLFMC